MILVGSREDFLEVLNHKLPSKCWAIEIGVFNGDFSEMILSILDPAGLTLIDPFTTDERITYNDGTPTVYSSRENYEKVLMRFRNDWGKRIHVYEMFSYDAKYKFFDETFDFIYHDASHLYSDLKRDLKEWLPKLKPTGLMCGHDYTDNPSFGVRQAVDEFCKEHNFEMVLLNQQGGDFALMRK